MLECVFFDNVKTKFGDILLVFKKDYSLIAIFLPTNNLSESLNDLKKLIEKKGFTLEIEEKSFPYKNVFIEYFKGEIVYFSDLKYDMDFFNPTRFQKDVWKVCEKIPYSSTKTYADIALALKKKCFRSVGVALGSNHLPLLIPCHRVVSKNGLGGFSATGGVEMKHKLLFLENPNYPKTI